MNVLGPVLSAVLNIFVFNTSLYFFPPGGGGPVLKLFISQCLCVKVVRVEIVGFVFFISCISSKYQSFSYFMFL